MEERPGEAGFTVLPEPPNEAPAKAWVLAELCSTYFLGSIIGPG